MTSASTARPGPGASRSLLVVEDDAALARLLERALSAEGYGVTVARDGQSALHAALTHTFDVMVVDRGLPAIEGLDLIARLRSSGVTCPVLVLSALGTTRDRIDGLDAGAEDYLAKPFDLDELAARLRALLRRHEDVSTVLRIAGGRLDVAARCVRRDDGDVALSERETDLLALLASRPQQVFSRRELLQRVFDDAESETVVDTYVHYCRRKLGRDVIRTVRGLGFTLGAP